MQMLQRVDLGRMLLQRLDTLGSRTRRSDRGDRRNTLQHSGAANRLLVEERILPMRRVQDELDALALDQIDYVRTALLHLEYALHHHARLLDHVGRALSSHKLETELDILTRQFHHRLLIAIAHA